MKITWHKHILKFKRPAGTSRSILTENPVWYVSIFQDGIEGIGECNPLAGLSIDDRADFEDVLNNPSGDGHQNIRNFINTGFEGLLFDGEPLTKK